MECEVDESDHNVFTLNNKQKYIFGEKNCVRVRPAEVSEGHSNAFETRDLFAKNTLELRSKTKFILGIAEIRKKYLRLRECVCFFLLSKPGSIYQLSRMREHSSIS